MARSEVQDLETLLTPVLAAVGIDLEGIDISAAGRRRRVCVIIDRDGGVDLDTVAEASRLVSDSLDASDVLGDSPYVLEVTSPGVDRPLTQPRHWRRARGRLVTCSLRDGTSVVGRVLESHDTAVTLATENGTVEVPLADIAKGQIEVEFRRVDEKGD